MSDSKVVWLIPSLGRGATGYPWHPVLKAFCQRFPQTQIFTTRWPGFASGYEDSFSVSTVGKPLEGKFLKDKDSREYGAGFMRLPLSIIGDLLQIRPDVIITKAFSVWTAIAIFYKLLFKSKVVIAYEGSSPKVNYQKSWMRSSYRKLLAGAADAFVTNTQSGKAYLSEALGASQNSVFVHPYEIASPHLLFESEQAIATETTDKKPIFITVGQLIPRKGVNYLLDACVLLKERGIEEYKLLIAGNGPQQAELEAFVEQQGLRSQIAFLGWVDYSSLGHYFEAADVFVFPTLADTWGLVTLEAMAIGKPAICSKHAGSAEMIVDDENGYVVEPQAVSSLADAMEKFILNPGLADEMGKRAQQSMAQYTPETVAQFLEDAVNFTVHRRE